VKRAAVVGVVVGSLVVTAGAAAAIWSLTRPPSIHTAAETYLNALSTGDFDAIEPMLPEGTTQVGTLEAAFAGASARIADVSFETRADGSVTADATLAGEHATIGFALTQHDGRWVLGSDALAHLEVSTTMGDSVRIGGALVPAGIVRLLPAEYPVSAAPAGIVRGEATAAVTGESSAAVALEASLSPGATTLAQEQIEAYAGVCAEPATTVPDHCGIVVPWAADLSALDAVAFRIDRLPSVMIAADGATFDATGGVLIATARGTALDGTAASFTYRAEDWSLRGSIRFDGDEMVLAVR
jgi:hypothetical protein